MDAAAPLLPGLRAATANERDARATLLQAVSDTRPCSPGPAPATPTASNTDGALSKPSIAIDDEARTLKLIRTKVPEDQQVLLIRVRGFGRPPGGARPQRQGLAHPGDSARFNGVDAPLVVLPKDDLDRLVDTLLAETAGGGA